MEIKSFETEMFLLKNLRFKLGIYFGDLWTIDLAKFGSGLFCLKFLNYISTIHAYQSLKLKM